MKTSQLNPTPSGVLGTMAKLIRLTEKDDVKWSHWQHPTNNVTARHNFAEYLKMGCPKLSSNDEVVTNEFPEGHELVRFIFGDDYITPEEIAVAYGVSYTDEQLEHFADTLPNIETILWLHANGYILIAGPRAEMNLLQVRKLDNELLNLEYDESDQKLAQTDVINAGQWLAIRKDEVPDSFDKLWGEQQNLLTEIEYVPNAPEVSYAVAIYYKVRDIYLLHGNHVRTSSVNKDNNHVMVNVDKNGLHVNIYWDKRHHCNVGVSSALSLDKVF